MLPLQRRLHSYGLLSLFHPVVSRLATGEASTLFLAALSQRHAAPQAVLLPSCLSATLSNVQHYNVEHLTYSTSTVGLEASPFTPLVPFPLPLDSPCRPCWI